MYREYVYYIYISIYDVYVFEKVAKNGKGEIPFAEMSILINIYIGCIWNPAVFGRPGNFKNSFVTASLRAEPLARLVPKVGITLPRSTGLANPRN